MAPDLLAWRWWAGRTRDEVLYPTPETVAYRSEAEIAASVRPDADRLRPVRTGDDPLLVPGRAVLCWVMVTPRCGLPRAVASLWVRAEVIPAVNAGRRDGRERPRTGPEFIPQVMRD